MHGSRYFSPLLGRFTSSFISLLVVFTFCAAKAQASAQLTPLQQRADAISERIASPNAVSIEAASLDELFALYELLNYHPVDWHRNEQAVPRITFAKLSPSWVSDTRKLPVSVKKSLFFKLMMPLILMSNEAILQERQQAESRSLNDPKLVEMALKYEVIGSSRAEITEAQRQRLLSRVDIIPPSLALAQAAEESGWATSRFTLEGHAYFGQWDYSGNGMVPKQQRKELGNYGLARFSSPLESVQGYMLNLNTVSAYNEFRALRRQLRDTDQAITGLELVDTLTEYSERGEAYTRSIRGLISYNELHYFDNAYLANMPVAFVIAQVGR
ncbi:glucosaminidase domain-containing protein [Thalassotalea sp. PS06]|uniref:glucosaminidase domain-containing protein n=1 Tax=Thalassotalea sp. PS06 TaxID=2594005 RepID=UPI0011649DF1|nr:glucosaminidase domain-containing protein [Thalassotalea sp. PS06]QDP01599.1 glucosaminidase [Thalassotalea sp. PS06]